ncbi:hypothetical protein O9992_25210 [Vibrio lentus]|nr:hypothetical protein [Vibrio lentus]
MSSAQCRHGDICTNNKIARDTVGLLNFDGSIGVVNATFRCRLTRYSTNRCIQNSTASKDSTFGGCLSHRRTFD